MTRSVVLLMDKDLVSLDQDECFVLRQSLTYEEHGSVVQEILDLNVLRATTDEWKNGTPQQATKTIFIAILAGE